MSDHVGKADSYAQESGSGRPIPTIAAQSDVLSEVLTLIRLRGELVYTAQLGSPWRIRFPAGPAHFHFVEEGCVWVLPCEGEAVRVNAGDLVLLPHGRGHSLVDAPDTTAEAVDALASPGFDRDHLTLQAGGGGASSRLVGGLFGFEGSTTPVITSVLPPVVHIPRSEGGAPPWLAAISHFLVDEARAADPGWTLMISRLIDLLVIRALRSWASTQTRRTGWLAGLGEERISRALVAMHADPFRRWTVNALAETALMSRSIFAQRFAATVGEPPLHYLARWRLTIAADLLRSGGMKVTEAAQRVGYASDAAFSRAFKAHFGYAPSEARHRP
ncbi:AraC family transcriptional regulator [Roseateles noduli]|uniref:AraC family transcriptional regulator n=1 Tax=Roseateles noduli TaxID=2052484 RepID=UPI003D645877